MFWNDPILKQLGDAGAMTSLIATFFGVLPDIAALLTVLWIAVRLWETDTVQALFGRSKKEPRNGV